MDNLDLSGYLAKPLTGPHGARTLHASCSYRVHMEHDIRTTLIAIA